MGAGGLSQGTYLYTDAAHLWDGGPSGAQQYTHMKSGVATRAVRECYWLDLSVCLPVCLSTPKSHQFFFLGPPSLKDEHLDDLYSDPEVDGGYLHVEEAQVMETERVAKLWGVKH